MKRTSTNNNWIKHPLTLNKAISKSFFNDDLQKTN